MAPPQRHISLREHSKEGLAGKVPEGRNRPGLGTTRVGTRAAGGVGPQPAQRQGAGGRVRVSSEGEGEQRSRARPHSDGV